VRVGNLDPAAEDFK
jgi:GPN-loop GTPase